MISKDELPSQKVSKKTVSSSVTTSKADDIKDLKEDAIRQSQEQSELTGEDLEEGQPASNVVVDVDPEGTYSTEGETPTGIDSNASSPSNRNSIGNENHDGDNMAREEMANENFADAADETVISAYIAPGKRRKQRNEPELVSASRMESKEEEESRRSTMFLVGCVFFMLIVGTVALVTYFVRGGKDTTENDSNNNALATSNTTVAPSHSPSSTTIEPSFDHTTIQPTETVTLQPTSTKLAEILHLLENVVPAFYQSDAFLQVIGGRNFPTPHQVTNLGDPHSPQFRAARWIAEIDDYPMPIDFSDFFKGYDFVSRYALAVFYYSTNGEGWHDQCNFLNTTLHQCSWQCDTSKLLEQQSLYGTNYSEADFRLLFGAINGAKCASYFGIEDEGIRDLVVGTEFIFNNLSGNIPPELGWGTIPLFLTVSYNPYLGGPIPWESLPSWLSVLQMHGNALEGTISSRVGEFYDLLALYLAQNKLGGSLPSQVGELTYLSVLEMYRNDLTGTLPSSMATMSSLWHFDLSENMLSGPIPSGLFAMEGLGSLIVQDNILTSSLPIMTTNSSDDLFYHFGAGSNFLIGTVPPTISTRTNLRILELWFNDLSGEIVADDSPLWSLTDLSHVHMRSNLFSGTISSNIGTLTALRGLLLNNNRLEGRIPAEFGSLVNSTYWSVGGNIMTGTLPTEFGLLTNLEVMGLYSNQFTGGIPSSFLSLTGLREFYVNGNDLTGSGIVNMCEKIVADFETSNVDFNYTADCDELECPCCIVCCRDNGRVCEPR